MGKNVLIALIAVMVLGGLAFYGYQAYQKNNTSYPNTETTDYGTPNPVESTIGAITTVQNTKMANLEEQNGSKEMGAVTLLEENGKVKVTIIMEGEPEGAVQPAHIHSGSCPTPGAVKFPLTNVVSGKSETTINTTMDALKAMLPLAVNVHESSANINNYVACGNLSL